MPKFTQWRVPFSRTLVRYAWRGFVVLVVLAFLTPVYTYTRERMQPQTATAAAGINRQINFQGKLVNPDGTNVTNGSYSIVFSIYSVSSGGTAIWTETQSVSVLNGIFQVDLGSVTALPGAVDFDTDNIYLGVKVGSDAEMTPRIRFTAVPQAFNAERLGGLDKTGFIQNTTSQQTANFNISGTGVVGTSLTTPTLQSGAGVGLTITGNAASTWSTTAGNLTLQTGGTGNIILNSAGVIDLQDNLQNSAGDLVLNDQVQLGGATGLQITTAGVITDVDGASVVIGENLSVTAGGASIVGSTTIATTAGNTLSLGNSTGALTVTGSSASTFVLNGVTVDTTEFNRLDGKDAALVDTNDAVATAITGTGALSVGSITSGFGAIDVGTDNISTTGALNGGTLTVTGNATFDTNTLFVDSTNNRVGVGTTSPNTALDVNGVISRAQNNTRLYKNVYTYNITGATQTGTIILTAPKGFTNTMLRFTIKGYDYTSTTGAWEAVIGGYAFATTPAWINTSTEIRGNAPFSSVRLGYDGTNVVIMLGTTTTVWQYPKVVIEEIVAGHSSVDDWGGTWSGALVTDETTPIAYSNIVTPPVRSPFIQGGNTFGATATLGTNDSQNLVLETANTARLTISSTGTATFSGSLQANAGLTVAGGASIQGNTTIATTAGNTLGIGNSTGALTVTGSSASTFILNGVTVDATEFNLLDGKDATLVDVNDSVNTVITGTGALTTGSIASGFGTILTANTITGTRLISTVANGTAPLQVTSLTVVTNFNADLLDGQSGSYYQNASNINAGTLAVARGGTGASSFTANGVLYGNGTSAIGVTPTATGVSQQCLTSSTAAPTPTWSDCTSVGSGASPGGAAGGDLSGNYPSPTVAKINGVTLGNTTATAGNVLIGDGSAWVSRNITGDLTVSSTGVVDITTNDYIQNTTSPQASANFNIDGDGVIGDALTVGGLATFNGGLTVAANNNLSLLQSTSINVVDASANSITTMGSGVYFRVTESGGGSSATTSIIGLNGGVNGRMVILTNVTGETLTLAHESASEATTTNRIQAGSGVGGTVLKNGASISLVYDSTSARWRVVGDGADADCNSCALRDLSNLQATSINQALLPDSNAGRNLGNSTTRWNAVYGVAFNFQKNDSAGFVGEIINTTTSVGTNANILKLQYSGLFCDDSNAASLRASNDFLALWTRNDNYAGGISAVQSSAACSAGTHVQYKTNGADYAEYFLTDLSNKPAVRELVSFKAGTANRITERATNPNLPIVGAVSDTAGFVGNGPYCTEVTVDTVDECQGNYEELNSLVSLVGQVKVKVNNSNGAIQVGDPIGLSTTPGIGAKLNGSGYIVGYAMESLPNANGEVLVLIRPSFYTAPMTDVLQGSGLNVDGDAVVSGNLTVGSDLNVSGHTTLSSLTVTGDATIQGNLTVVGDLETRDITINGHIITGGDAPVISVGAGAGVEDLASAINAPTVTVTGNDTSGTITLTTGAGGVADVLATLNFAKDFTNKPRVVLSPANREAAKLGIYYDAVTASTSAINIMTDIAPEAGKTYVFTYFIVE